MMFYKKSEQPDTFNSKWFGFHVPEHVITVIGILSIINLVILGLGWGNNIFTALALSSIGSSMGEYLLFYNIHYKIIQSLLLIAFYAYSIVTFGKQYKSRESQGD